MRRQRERKKTHSLEILFSSVAVAIGNNIAFEKWESNERHVSTTSSNGQWENRVRKLDIRKKKKNNFIAFSILEFSRQRERESKDKYYEANHFDDNLIPHRCDDGYLNSIFAVRRCR